MLVREIAKQVEIFSIPVYTPIYNVTLQEVDFLSFPIKSGLGHVTCYGQWGIIKGNTSRSPKVLAFLTWE